MSEVRGSSCRDPADEAAIRARLDKLVAAWGRGVADPSAAAFTEATRGVEPLSRRRSVKTNKEYRKKGKEAEVKRPSPERVRPVPVDAVPFVLGPRLTPKKTRKLLHKKNNNSVICGFSFPFFLNS
jgi:hypothetical protein